MSSDEDLARVMQEAEMKRFESQKSSFQQRKAKSKANALSREDSIIAQQLYAEQVIAQMTMNDNAIAHQIQDGMSENRTMADSAIAHELQNELSEQTPLHTTVHQPPTHSYNRRLMEQDEDLALQVLTQELQLQEDRDFAASLQNNGGVDTVDAVTPAGPDVFSILHRDHNPQVRPRSQGYNRGRGNRGSTPNQLRPRGRAFLPQLVFQPHLHVHQNDDQPPESYEELLEWEERRGAAVSKGIQKNQIDALPSICFKGDGGTAHSIEEDLTQCKICMCDFETDEKLRPLPCLHKFHVQCIDQWLKINAVCPICKLDVKEQLKRTSKT